MNAEYSTHRDYIVDSGGASRAADEMCEQKLELRQKMDSMFSAVSVLKGTLQLSNDKTYKIPSFRYNYNRTGYLYFITFEWQG